VLSIIGTWKGRRAQPLYCAFLATGQADPIEGGLLSKRRNKAIAPYGPRVGRATSQAR